MIASATEDWMARTFVSPVIWKRRRMRGAVITRVTDPHGLEELIIALHDIGEILERPVRARLARIGRAAEQVTGRQRTS